ncbi:MAG: magnesium chelatase, partial [Lentisphaeraceae bacterium]|nr:magnesium chelatase [Lentisphaeraceae bacterium]
MLTKVWSCALNGITPFTVEVEVSNNAQGNENYVSIVGLPDAAVRESKERIRSAVYASGLKYPEGSSTVALAPADVKKSGSALDLPISIGLLAIVCAIPKPCLEGTMMIGELALDGTLRPVKGCLAMAIHAREKGFKRLLVPEGNSVEASVASGVDVYPIKNLLEAYKFLIGEEPLVPVQTD